MKTRIISGAVIVVVAGAVLGLSLKFPLVIITSLAILAAMGVYEALHSTGIVKNKIITAVASLFAFILPFVENINLKIINTEIVCVVFAVLQFAVYLKFHKDISLDGMLGMIILPMAIAYGFSALGSIVLFKIDSYKLIFIVLVLCWSAISDTGAYFVGVAFGKHKMSPVISPKKSWEGLIGGMVFSVLAVMGVCLLYNSLIDYTVNIAVAMAITPLFVLIGVLGDLTASLIKRKCGIKDFGKLIPGHGGILDRFDSILMISAVLKVLLNYIQL